MLRLPWSAASVLTASCTCLTTASVAANNVNVININGEALMPIVAKLDELGKPAWIALMILGFMVWWPVGLATLAFIIGSGRMSLKGGGVSRWHEATAQMRSAGTWWQPSRSSGNRAFDEYREETLHRLEAEQREFQDFLVRLRAAKDKAEFDQFMAERSARTEPAS